MTPTSPGPDRGRNDPAPRSSSQVPAPWTYMQKLGPSLLCSPLLPQGPVRKLGPSQSLLGILSHKLGQQLGQSLSFGIFYFQNFVFLLYH